LWRRACIIVIYTDDTIVAGKNRETVEHAIKEIGQKFPITSSDVVADFLGVNISFSEDKHKLTFSQPQLIRSIIKDLGLTIGSKTHRTPAVSNVVLHAHEGSPDHFEPWNYRSIIGKLNYLEKCSRLDISFAVHQCARFCERPKIEHTAAVKRIGRYLLSSIDQGIICTPGKSSLTSYVDASFLPEWYRSRAMDDPITAHSRTGYVIMYSGCPVLWCSKLQTDIAHSSTEAEYIALSHSLKEVTSIMHLLDELKAANFDLNTSIPTVH
jgi:hypothetical protein